MNRLLSNPGLLYKIRNNRIRNHGILDAKRGYIVNPTGWSFDEVTDLAQEISNLYKESYGEGQIWFNLRYPGGWFGQVDGAQGLGEPVLLFTYHEYHGIEQLLLLGKVLPEHLFPEKFYQLDFRVEKFRPKSNVGGKDPHNDCLFNAISQLLNKKRLPLWYNTPEKLKRRLGVGRNQPISITLIPKVEKFYKVNIIVEGDHPYDGSTEFPKTIRILLKDEHYSPITRPRKGNKLLKQYEHFSKNLNVYYRLHDVISLYDGKTIRNMSYSEYADYKKKMKKSTIFIQSTTPELIDFFKDYKANAKLMKEATDGMIDLYRAEKLKSHALALFDKLSNGTKKPDPIGQYEASRLKSKAPLISAIPGVYYNCYEYDMNFMYGFLMSNNMFPVLRGESITLETLPDKLEYGIYDCEIEYSEDMRMLFRWNPTNEYTHYDIMTAREAGLKVSLIKKENNAYIYTKDKLEYGSRLFKPTVDYLYSLSQNHKDKSKSFQSLIKQIRSTLWGGLYQRKVMNHIVKEDEGFIPNETSKIYQQFQIDNGKHRVKTCKLSDQFATDYARIGPFITAQARRKMYTVFKDHVKDIVRIHTDGVLLLNPCPKLKIGTGIGQWKKVCYQKASFNSIRKRSNLDPPNAAIKTEFIELKTA